SPAPALTPTEDATTTHPHGSSASTDPGHRRPRSPRGSRVGTSPAVVCARRRARAPEPVSSDRRCDAALLPVPDRCRLSREPDDDPISPPGSPRLESTPRINASWPLRIAAGLKSPTFLLPTNG